MDMRDQEESRNVVDDRGAGGGGGGFQFRPVHGIGLGTIAVALVGGWLLGINPLTMLGLLSGNGLNTAPTQQGVAADAPPEGGSDNDDTKKFVSQILRSTEQVWTTAFAAMGRTYETPKLVLYRGQHDTACGTGQSAAGPFYCPNDHIVYLDLGFYDLMTQQLQAPGQFAHAYVIAHEVGHHVQNLLGIIPKVDALRQRSSETESNALSVKLELQADCLAGVWAKLAQTEDAAHGWLLQQGDVETALNAAQQIGDDTLQKRAQGTVVPDSFTHGTSAERVQWLKRGIDSGDINACDTFGTGPLVPAAGTGSTQP